MKIKPKTYISTYLFCDNTLYKQRVSQIHEQDANVTNSREPRVNKTIKVSSFKRSENTRKKECGPDISFLNN